MEGKTDPIELFRERFSGHELPAPDGAWEAISSQLTLHAATSTDGVNELFRDRFAQHEAPVDPGVWSSIEGHLGNAAAGGAGAGAGWSTVAGWAAAGVAVLLMTAGVVYLNEEPRSARPAIAAIDPPPAQTQGTPVAPLMTAAATTPPIEPSTSGASATRDAVVRAPGSAPNEQRNVQPSDAVVVPPNERTATNTAVGPLNPTANMATAPPTTEISTLPQQVIGELLDAADHKVLQPATVPDTALDDDKPVMAPPVFGSEPEAERFHIFLPNVFTPYNHDGINDEYLPQGEGIGSAIIRVYAVADNRLVFSSNELTPWDGRDMNTGEYCTEGHYLYALEAIGTDGNVHTQGQVVLLMR